MNQNEHDTRKNRTDHQDTGADGTNYRTFLQMQGKHQETTTCRLCEAYPEGTMHWMSACPYLAGSEYLKRHNQALKVFYVALAKKVGLLDPKLAWFNVHIAPIIENNEVSIH